MMHENKDLHLDIKAIKKGHTSSQEPGYLTRMAPFITSMREGLNQGGVISVSYGAGDGGH